MRIVAVSNNCLSKMGVFADEVKAPIFYVKAEFKSKGRWACLKLKNLHEKANRY